ncbi:MAG: NB-ARC domain-containing protein, partial [Cyanobacteria bacterium J06635_11]
MKAQLLCEDASGSGILVVSAIYGLGGIGKSVLAAKLAHDPDVQARFSDGILWATLGQAPDILPLLSGWIQAMGDYNYKPTVIQSASNHLRTLLYGKRALLVVDDVWNSTHLEPFQVGSDESCVLVTTREARIPDAKRYDLDVMDEGQAIELMTQKLSEPLDANAREQAEAFAKRVGYLPLALELAASQIEEGFSAWQDLLADLNKEVARLESLNIYGPGDNLREGEQRRYSLLACFNLSLKRLPDAQRRQFAWLGIIPEDVSLTEAMAETLWQVNSRQAREILHSFRSKSLILSSVQQADGQPSFRMHDLMHDLAQRLLTTPEMPVAPGNLPGLGLTTVEAHRHLLALYRAKTTDGQWHTLLDDGYIHAYLTWHMEGAQQPEAIHQLLQASNKAGRNSWYAACEAIGKPAGFASDVGRAWRLDKQAPSQAVALLFHYALIRGSLNSLASNVPAELVGALVEKEIWQPAQGLAYAQQARNPRQRAECISAIVPYMPQTLLPEVLNTISNIKDVTSRAYVLSKLAEHFPEVWPDVLTAIQQIQDRYGEDRKRTEGFSYRALALESIVHLLPSQYWSQALAIAREIQDVSDRAQALVVFCKYLPELLPEALEVTRGIQDESSRSDALIGMSKQLPAELLPEALEVTRGIQDESSRSDALI